MACPPPALQKGLALHLEQLAQTPCALSWEVARLSWKTANPRVYTLKKPLVPEGETTTAVMGLPWTPWTQETDEPPKGCASNLLYTHPALALAI